MTIGILYIATGRYITFWEEFYKSAEKYLLPNHQKHYFVFTDEETKIIGEKKNVTKIYQKKLGWPYDTLMRFDMFLRIEKELEKMDYIYFFNANMKIIREIGEEFLPKQEGLMAIPHAFHYHLPREKFTYDTNPKSLACIYPNEGEYYFMGGLNGGKSKDYIELIKTLDRNIKEDLKNDVIALWHDESHINRYFIDNKPLITPPQYAWPEGLIVKYYDYYEDIDYDKISNDIKVILPNKDHHRFGGSEWLRGKPHKNKLVERLSFIIYRERIKCKEFDRYYHFKVKNHFKIDDKLKIFRKYVTLKKIIFNKLKIILNL